MADPVDRDPVLMTVADGLETTAEDRARWLDFLTRDLDSISRLSSLPRKEATALLRDFDRLLSERHRAEEAMRERAAEVLADLGLRADTTQAARALDTARFALLALPLTPEPTHER